VTGCFWTTKTTVMMMVGYGCMVTEADRLCLCRRLGMERGKWQVAGKVDLIEA